MSDYSFFKEDFPAIDWFDVTPDDNNDLSRIPRRIWVGGSGDLTIRSSEGTDVTLSSVPAGTLVPVQPVRVLSTNTTATNIVGLI